MKKPNRLALTASMLSVLLCVSFLSGCDNAPDLKRIEHGKLKLELFRECMTLASANARKGDDDVSDIVDSCGDQAYYTAMLILDR